MIFSAIENRPRTHVYALLFSDAADDHDLVKRALRQKNLIVVGSKTGIVGGRQAEWNLDETTPFADIVFEPGPKTDADPRPRTGKMNLGDIAKFCQFLSSMGDH